MPPRLLFATDVDLLPLDRGIRVRVSNLLAAARRAFAVTLVAPPPACAEDRARMESQYEEVLWLGDPQPVAAPWDHLGVFWDAVRATPGLRRVATLRRYLPFAAALRTLQLEDYDLIWAERPHIARLFRGHHERTIVDLDDLEHVRVQKARPIAGHRRRADAFAEFCHYHFYRWLEVTWSQSFVARVVCSEQDKTYLEQRGRANVAVVPNGASESVTSQPIASPVRMASGPLRLVFLGNVAHLPNLDAITHFVEEILPLIRTTHPEVAFHVLGPSASQAIRRRFAPYATFLGYVPELSAALANYDVLVAPIRFGSGTRVKLLDAMACGIPIVTTAAGAEGLPVVHGEHLLIAEGRTDFVDKVIRLKRDPDLGRRLTAKALELVEQRYQSSTIQQRTAEWLAGVVSARRAAHLRPA